MPYLMHTGARVDLVVDTMVDLLNRDGIESISLRKIADRIGLSPSTLSSHLSNKRRIIDLATKQIGDRVVRAVGGGLWRHGGIPAFVPDEDCLPVIRAWLAMSELARADDELGLVVGFIEQQFRDLLSHACRSQLDEITTDAVFATVTGLWAAMCARSEPMPAERARAILRHACTAMGIAPTGEPET